MKILIKFPSRSRPSKFFDRINEIQQFIGLDDYQILATLDSDDLSMNNATIIKRMDACSHLRYIFGKSRNKIDACNRDLDKTGPYDIILLQSDDMIWQRTFGPTIVEAFQKYYPDTDGVVHIPDQVAGDKLITYSIAGRRYIERFGYMYYPGYSSVYCDNEFTEVAKSLGRYTYLHDTVGMLIHAHPVWNLSPWDDLYISTESEIAHQKDRNLFLLRRKKDFDD